MRLLTPLALAALFGAAPTQTASAAMNCAAAKTKSEKAICADPQAQQADAALGEAFARLRDALLPEEKAGLVASQRAWLERRDSDCGESKTLGACLREASETRMRYLTGKADAGPGASVVFAPSFYYLPGGPRKTKIVVDAVKIVDPAAPGAGAFNRAVGDIYKDAQVEKTLTKADLADMPARGFEYSLQMRIVYASPKLVSVHGEFYADSGGAHPNSGTQDINFDPVGGRLFALSDILDAEAQKKVTGHCLAEVKKQKTAVQKEWGEADPLPTDPKDVAEATADFKHWSFAPDGATVSYDAYAVGSYAEGRFECQLPYAFLRPLARPTFPLP
jgi:uncharacterized protein YecT (DUF1311 family)